MSIQNNASDSALVSNHRTWQSIHEYSPTMTCAYGWAVSATAARATKASLPKYGAQPGTTGISAPGREARESRGQAPRISAAAAAPPCDDDQAWIRRRIRGRPVG